MSISWKFAGAEDCTVEDDETQLWHDGKYTHISIQHCLYGGGYAVNEYTYDAHGHLDGVKHHRMMKSLNKAKRLALEIFGERT